MKKLKISRNVCFEDLILYTISWFVDVFLFSVLTNRMLYSNSAQLENNMFRFSFSDCEKDPFSSFFLLWHSFR